jgi:hypothetical protein
VLTKDTPCSYTKSGLEEILRGLKCIVPYAGAYEDRGLIEACEKYWQWVRNEEMKEKQK